MIDWEFGVYWLVFLGMWRDFDDLFRLICLGVLLIYFVGRSWISPPNWPGQLEISTKKSGILQTILAFV